MKILFLQPLFYNPVLPNFKDRFELLSSGCEGYVISPTGEEFMRKRLRFGRFTYIPMPMRKRRTIKYLEWTIRILWTGMRIRSRERLDYIHAYDPIFFGFVAVLLAAITGAKPIVEVNGQYQDPASTPNAIKRFLFRAIAGFVLRKAEVVKFLNRKQAQEWKEVVNGKKTYLFHTFVPTHAFHPERAFDGGYILLMGHPFRIKGVDVLIRAFLKISHEFPEMRLKIIGHCPGGERERNHYRNMAEGNKQVEILRPVPYDEAIHMMEGCTFFVLPSRSEAMGRVLIEAMACGKAVIGSRTGGIPELIRDGFNGFLVDPEDVDGLAARMKILLSNRALREEMGKRGLEMVQKRFSSHRYVENFIRMLEDME